MANGGRIIRDSQENPNPEAQRRLQEEAVESERARLLASPNARVLASQLRIPLMSGDPASDEGTQVSASELGPSVVRLFAERPVYVLRTVDPTASDDFTAGYLVGTRWLNATTRGEFLLVDSTPGAAVWLNVAIYDGQTVMVAPQGAPFTSVKAACDSIIDSGPTKPYVVRVAPGLYNEDPFTIPTYVSVVGNGAFGSVVLTTTNANSYFITGSIGAEIRNVEVYGPTGVGFAAIDYQQASLTPFFIYNVIIRAGYYGVWCHPAAARGLVHAFFVGNRYVGVAMENFFRCTGRGNITAVASGFMSGPPSKVAVGFYCAGPDSEMTLDACFHRNGGATTGLFADDGAHLDARSTTLSAGATAVHVGGTGTGTEVDLTAVNIQNTFTTDILIDAGDARVQFSGAANKDQIIQGAGTEFHANFTHKTVSTPDEDGAAVYGELWLGTANSQIPLASYMRDTLGTGWVVGGAITRGVGLNVSIASGVGYINTGAGTVVKVAWAGTSKLLAADSEEWIYVDAAGSVLVNSGSEPDDSLSIVLGVCRTTATAVVANAMHAIELPQHPAEAHEYSRDVIGPINVIGTVVTSNGANLLLDVSSGVYYTANTRRVATGNVQIKFASWYRDGLGDWVIVDGTSPTSVDPEFYDDGSGVLAAVPAGEWTKHLLFVTVGGDGTEYHLVYGQETFASQVLAETGDLPVPPLLLRDEALRVGGIVSQQGTVVVASITDERPRIGQLSTGSTGITNHDDLTGRGSLTAHTQYRLASEQESTRVDDKVVHVLGGGMVYDGTGTTTANGVQYTRVWLSSGVILASMRVYITAGADGVRQIQFGLYSQAIPTSDAGVPNALVASTAADAPPGAFVGYRTVALTVPYTVTTSGWYWIAVQVSAGPPFAFLVSATMRANSVPRREEAAGSFTLPSPAGATTSPQSAVIYAAAVE